MKKIILFVIASALLLLSLAACQAAQPVSGSTAAPASAAPSSEPAAAAPSEEPAAEAPAEEAAYGSDAPITVISREDGSGTRGAFIELFGVLGDDDVDNTAVSAEITNSTSVMMTSVVGNPNAIGYISLGSMDDTVKAVKIDGVDASVDNINNGSYTVSRPFIIATKDGVSELAQDFIAYIMSTEGQDVVEANGYIRVEETGAYAGTALSGKIIVAGSSSVTPVMEKLIEAYQLVNSGAEIELQTSDSSAGMTYTIDGVCDIGMASRELKDSELESGLQPTTMAVDGIAVIVHNDNSFGDLSKEQVRQIFTGEVTNWSELN